VPASTGTRAKRCGRRQAGGGADFEFGLVVGGEQQVGGVAVEHVAGAFYGALEQAVEVVGAGSR